MEVARRAGVSLSTVSRVFRGTANVADSTRRRVLQAARELGYQPNVAARMLRTGCSTAIGLILPHHYYLRGQFHADALAGFETTVAEWGLRVVISTASAGPSLHRCARDLLASGQCGGLAVQADEIAENDIAVLRQITGPIVLMNYTPKTTAGEIGLSTVGFDNRGGTAKAVRHLVALGHRKIAFIGGTPASHDAQRREEGFRRAMEEVGLPIIEEWILPGHFGHGEGGFESGRVQMDHLLSEGPAGPTAVLCASDEIAMGALETARRCGKVVPRDLSLIGFDNHSWSAYSNPPLTTVNHSGWELGVAVARRLLAHLQNPEEKPATVVLETQLVIRDSTARVPER